MSKLLLGSLVAAMLTLTGVVAYNTINPAHHACPLSANSADTSCCGDSATVAAPACCAEGSTPTKVEAPCCKEVAPAAVVSTPETGVKKD